MCKVLQPELALFHDAQNRGGSASLGMERLEWKGLEIMAKMEVFSVNQGNCGQKFCFGSGIEKQNVYCREFVKQT